MATINKNTIRLNYRIKATQNGKTILCTHRRVKAKIVSLVEATSEKQGHIKWYIKVDYGNEGLINDGTYDNKHTLLKALDDFTEKSLVKYAIS